MKEVHSTSQSNISNKQVCETKTIKQVQTTVTEKTVVHKQNVSEQMSQKQTEKKEITQKHSVKNIKGEYRNLDMKGKSVIKKAKPEIHFPPPPSSPPPPSESELSLPPPPSPVLESPASPPSIMRQDSDLPPPPPPPPMEGKSEPDFFPLPPPPPQDFLPPPPSQQELNALPQSPPAKLGKPIGKPLFKLPKQPETLKLPVQVKPKWQKKQPTPSPPPPPPPPPTQLPPEQAEIVSTERKEVQEVKKETKQIEISKQIQSESKPMSPTKIPSIPAMKPKESPQPPKRVFVPPIKLPPTPEPPKSRPFARKFKTPLMLAEERYRLQLEKEESMRSTVTTPTSPPINLPFFAASPEPPAAQKADSEVATEAAKSEEAKAISKEGIPPPKKTPSQIPLSKPLISVVNKKSAAGSSSVSVDKKHVASEHSSEKMLSSTEVIKKSQTATKNQTVVSQSNREASNIEIQSCSNVVTSSVTEQQQQFIKKSSTRSITATQSDVHENANLQSQSAVTLKAEDVKNINAPLTLEGKMSPSHPTKIPKVTPSFKVKTFKMPKEKKEEKLDSAMKSEVHLQQEKSSVSQKSETKVSQKSEQVTSAKTEMKTEMKVIEKKSHVTPAMEKVEVEVQVKKGTEMHRNEAGVQLSPSVTALMPKMAKITSAATHQGQGHASVSHSQQSMKVESSQRHEEVVVTERVVQQRLQKQEVVQLTTFEETVTTVEKQVKDKEEKEEREEPSAPPAVPPKPDKKVFSGATTKISKISIGSSKSERKVVEEKKSIQERKVHQEISEDQRVSSPLASIRSPSPTFISIESRRIDSPLRVTPSPPPYKSVGTPPPPPRKSFTPTSPFRATPSPTMSRSEKLVKLRDTTSMLSRVITPPPPMPVQECIAAERELSSSLSDRETPVERDEQGLMEAGEMGDSMMTVRDKKSFFEEAQKAEVSKTYMRKDPIDIPERLGAEAEEGAEAVNIELLKQDLPRVDLSKLVNRFESPQPKVYNRKEPIVITERLGSDTEDAEDEPAKSDEIPTFNVKAIKNVFETGELGSQAARDLREQIERRESESAPSEPAGHSETTAVAEQFCTVDVFGNITDGTTSEGSVTRGNPPSYAEVVRGETVSVPPEASTEELLRNFQQSWAESQGVFQNLGFSVTEQRTSQIVTHQQQTVVTENSSSRVRAVQGVSEEGVPDGVADRRQTQLP
ncbi:Xin actin-binding repeat-containing protein 2 [Dissostichus eleginoides]|uniref:Xin actin-binding repeat-containing protein 2 n=1 Tax=Dissostichus eleginoides TaxID=100907 RepID=A0AAD9B6B4_DISEL|nr:Xin actin-binding repeat-containing protein 2 [Dissostichus eleginoides]